MCSEGVQTGALYGTCAFLACLTVTSVRSTAKFVGLDSWQQSAICEHMQLSETEADSAAAADSIAGLRQQEF